MEPLVRVSLGVRTLWRSVHGLAAALALSAYLVGGGAQQNFSSAQGAALLAWATLLAVRVRRKLSGDARPASGRPAAAAAASGRAPSPLLLDVEVGVLLAIATLGGLVRFDGGLNGRFSPLVYVLVAVVAAFARPLAGIAVVGWIVGLEAALRFVTLAENDTGGFLTHTCFVGAFALLNLALLRAELARVRASARARIEAQLVQIREDARVYRLLGSGGEGGAEAAAGDGADREGARSDRLARASVEEIHLTVHYALDLLRRSLDLHTAVLLWLNDRGTHLRIRELSTASEEILDAPFPAADGVLGAALAQRGPVAIHKLRASHRVPYYARPCPVRAFAAIPVLEGETLRGILAVDRLIDRAFLPEEQEITAQAARFCLRAIQNERMFLQLERAKVEQGKLYRAARSLGAALSEQDVVDAGVKAAREIASFDVAAVTVYDAETRMHEVVAAKGDGGEVDALVGVRFAHNTGLVSMVVQNRCPLPWRGEHEAKKQVVLARRLRWPAHPSLLVLPLPLHDRALGTLILGARRRGAFGDAVRPTLEVLASHLAVSLSNARMVHKLETMATTDGLTGLLNKRAMSEAAEQKIAAAARFQRKLACLVVDIDFFKKVNDTHGHDVGDLVIRGLGDVLKRQKRATDLVARFGGEEFVVLCEQTDEKGAVLLAERIREELGKTSFRTATASVAVTCSIGVATFPEAGDAWETLFKAADEALYISKRSGRNRSTPWRASSAPPRKAAAASR
jgi:diguanylate cyclase (GGDEF)-like protein